MSSLLQCASHVLAKQKKKGEDLSPELKNKVYKKITTLADQWQDGKVFSAVRDAKYNTFDQFERIYEEATKLPFDAVEVIPTLKSLNKFEIRLHEFNATLMHKDGAIMSNLKLPRRILQRLPELKKYQEELTSQTGYFRRENVDNNKRVNNILFNFKKLAGAMGGDANEYSKIEKALEPILQNKIAGKKFDKNRYTELMNAKQNTLSEGAGRANIMLIQLFQGRSARDLRKEYKLGSYEESLLNKMKSQYSEVRKSTSNNLIKAMEKIVQINKGNNDPTIIRLIKEVKDRIRDVEFQTVIDNQNKPIKNLDYWEATKELQAFGFREGSPYVNSDGKVLKVSNSQYMPQYTLGLPKILTKLEKAVRGEIEGTTLKELTDSISDEVKAHRELIGNAKRRSVVDSPYSLDPFMFLNKYIGDINLFNYKVHIKDSFKRATDTLLNEHLKPAKAAKNEAVTEALEYNLQVATDVYNTIQKLDVNDTVVSDNLMRTLSSLTYFRLLGGNFRSAVRNATQRVYELHRWGLKGIREGRRFYSEAGGTENAEMANSQAKRFGLLWFEGKEVGSKVIDAFKGNAQLSNASRGALQENFMTGKGLRVSADGEIVRSTDGITSVLAKTVSGISDKTALMHKIVEDWNRTRTFRMGFAIAYKNLQNMSPEWLQRKSKIDPNNDMGGEKLKRWMANEAGQIGYNTTLDIHYEYANWAKAKALQNRKGAGGKIGQFFGQFMHYRFSNFDMMYKWYKDAKVSAFAGDFTSEEMFIMMRLGVVHGLVNNIFAPALNIRTDSLLQNDVAETVDTAYTYLSADRNDPEQVKELERKTYGQGGSYFLGPNLGLFMSIAEVKEMRDEMDPDLKNELTKNSKFISDREKKYKLLSLVNAQLARSWIYTAPIFFERGLVDATRLEAGVFPDQEIKDIRDSAKKWVDRNLHPVFKADWMKYKGKKKKKKKRPADDIQATLQALSMLS